MTVADSMPEVAPAVRVRVPGNSGCRVEVLPFKGRLAVRKTACSPAYALRLAKQRAKQEEYGNWLNFEKVLIPRIIASDECSFTMEHLQMLDCVEFFERATPRSVESRFRLLLAVIGREAENAKPCDVQGDIILEKLESIRLSIDASVWSKCYAGHADTIRQLCGSSLHIPIGRCHGDLTLSNVMFSLDETCIGMIDFLDSFIDSPLVDLAKIRQDTRHGWTNRRYHGAHDMAKVAVVNRWLDSMVSESFGLLISSSAFSVIERMNYMRIAPYASSPNEHEYLRDVLDQLCN